MAVLMGGLAVVLLPSDNSQPSEAEPIEQRPALSVDAVREVTGESAEEEGDLSPSSLTEVDGTDEAADAAPLVEGGIPSETEADGDSTQELEQAMTEAASADTAEKPAEPKPKRAKCSHPEIEKRDGVYYVPKSLLDGYAASPGKATSLGSFWWGKNKKGDKTGVRFGELPCPGVLRASGFRRGDLVVSVNGSKPTSIARAVSIYGAARKAGSADVVVRRGKKGKKKTVKLHYTFTD